MKRKYIGSKFKFKLVIYMEYLKMIFYLDQKYYIIKKIYNIFVNNKVRMGFVNMYILWFVME